MTTIVFSEESPIADVYTSDKGKIELFDSYMDDLDSDWTLKKVSKNLFGEVVSKEYQVNKDLILFKSRNNQSDDESKNKIKEYEFFGHTNKENLIYALEHDLFDFSDFIMKNETLYKVLKDWMDYKETDKKFHYKKNGMKKELKRIVDICEFLPIHIVVSHIERAIATGWVGTNLQILENQKRVTPKGDNLDDIL